MKARAPTDQSFFLPGACNDSAYRNVRDNPDRPEVRAFVDSLWSRYHDLADPHFFQDARNHFLERFWEMYLAVTLRERELQLKKDGHAGPEFYFLYNGHKIWVEAVTPQPGDTKDQVPDYDYGGEVTEVPTEKILLRFTNALNEKKKKYIKALQKKIISPDDLYVIAINSRAIPHAPYRKTMPYFVQAFLPFGNLAMLIDSKTGKIDKTFYQHRDNIKKASGAPVSTTAFLDPEYSFVSAVLHSGVDCVNRPAILGEDFTILHNPTAIHPLDTSIFQWCEQMFYQNGRLNHFAANIKSAKRVI
jgi:hypothetical protein